MSEKKMNTTELVNTTTKNIDSKLEKITEFSSLPQMVQVGIDVGIEAAKAGKISLIEEDFTKYIDTE